MEKNSCEEKTKQNYDSKVSWLSCLQSTTTLMDTILCEQINQCHQMFQMPCISRSTLTTEPSETIPFLSVTFSCGFGIMRVHWGSY